MTGGKVGRPRKYEGDARERLVAARKVWAEKFLEEMKNPEDHRHGKNSSYAKGCRCDRCKDASREYNRGKHEAAWEPIV